MSDKNIADTAAANAAYNDNNEYDEYIKTHYDEAVRLLEELGRIPAPTRQEDRRAAFCRDWFLAQGAEDVWIDQAKNTLCAINMDDSNDLAVFMAHTDIVFADTEELPMHRDGNILHAPGIGDDTANLVNLMMAAKYLLTKKPLLRMGILIVANACEEGLGNLDGSKEIMNSYGERIKAFYSFDGYLSQCTDTPVGSHRYKLTASAEGGHSYLNYGNESAILVMTELIHSLSRISLPTQDKTTCNVGYIQGGTTVNSIPEECYCLYEYRSPSQDCLEDMKIKLKTAIDEHRQQGRKIKTELLGVRPGKGRFEPGVLEAFTANSTRQIQAYYDGPLDRQPFSTDANIPLSMGIPANTIGTVAGGKAHTREEWVDLDSLKTGMGIVLAVIGCYFKNGDKL